MLRREMQIADTELKNLGLRLQIDYNTYMEHTFLIYDEEECVLRTKNEYLIPAFIAGVNWGIENGWI